MNAAYFIDFLIRKTQKNDLLDYDQFTCYILDNDDRKTLFSEYMCDNSREKSIHKCIEIVDNYFKHCLALVDINDFIINPNETFVERVKHLKSILPQKINSELLEVIYKTSVD